jgi:hypothetical protein
MRRYHCNKPIESKRLFHMGIARNSCPNKSPYTKRAPWVSCSWRIAAGRDSWVENISFLKFLEQFRSLQVSKEGANYEGSELEREKKSFFFDEKLKNKKRYLRSGNGGRVNIIKLFYLNFRGRRLWRRLRRWLWRRLRRWLRRRLRRKS